MRGDVGARMEALRNTCNLELNKNDTYGDGDQSLVKDQAKQQQLRDAVSSGLARSVRKAWEVRLS